MIYPKQIEDAVKLLQSGLSQRKVAAKLHISKASVGKIARGKLKRKPRPERWEDKPPFGNQVARCRECGAMVYQPCLACRVRNS